MNRVAASALLALCPFALAQAPQLHSGSTVFIEPMDGYETYMAAAIMKKHVPLIVVTDKEKAEFTITSSVHERAPSNPAIVVNNTNVNNGQSRSGYPAPGSLGRTNASISVVDVKTSQVVFAHSTGSVRGNQMQKTAEDCAKHMKEFIEKGEKPKK